jgi:hypothetical protein
MTPDIFQAYQTPEAMQVQGSECPVVKNKFYQLISEESYQSANNEDCSIMLRKMELDDSESDGESAKSVLAQDNEVLSLGDLLSSDVNTRNSGSQAMEVLRIDPGGGLGDVWPNANPVMIEGKKL